MLTLHHLIPRKLHRRAFFKKNYSRDQLGTCVLLCRTCHRGIHKIYTEMQLAKEFYTLEMLRADPAITKHAGWVAKQRVASLKSTAGSSESSRLPGLATDQ